MWCSNQMNYNEFMENQTPTLEMFAQVVCTDASVIFEACDTKEQFIDALTGKKPCFLYNPEEFAGLIWDRIVEQYSVGHSLGENGCQNCKKSHYYYDEFFKTYDAYVQSKQFSDLRLQNAINVV